MEISIPISIGELLDKISIIQIKKEKILDKSKLKYLSEEFEILSKKAEAIKNIDQEAYNNFYNLLYEINIELWDIEDKLRELEYESNFDDNFVKLARSVYITNDKRFEIKSNINNFFKSSIVEQKELKKY